MKEKHMQFLLMLVFVVCVICAALMWRNPKSAPQPVAESDAPLLDLFPEAEPEYLRIVDVSTVEELEAAFVQAYEDGSAEHPVLIRLAPGEYNQNGYLVHKPPYPVRLTFGSGPITMRVKPEAIHRFIPAEKL